jgi:hypothetical protein
VPSLSHWSLTRGRFQFRKRISTSYMAKRSNIPMSMRTRYLAMLLLYKTLVFCIMALHVDLVVNTLKMSEKAAMEALYSYWSETLQ